MVRPISDERRAEILQAVDQGITDANRIVREQSLGHWGVPFVSKIIESHLVERGMGTISAEPESKAPTVDETAEKIAKSREMKWERDALMAVAGEKSFRAFLEGLVRDVVPAMEPVARLPRPEPGRWASQETMLTVWSDWHAFETVTLDRTMGFNEFNARILGERLRRDVTARIDIKDRLERGGGWRIPRLVIAANGDFVSGTIHEVERHSEGKNVVESSWYTSCLMAAAIADLAPHFERVDVYCTAGNHGRLPDARRMQQKDPTRNWDTLIYLMAMQQLARFPNVRFHIPNSYFVLYEIEGWQFLQTHGHDIKSWNSIPYYGIDRFGRNIQALHAGRKERIDYFVISHFHSAGAIPAAGGETIVNGSLIGGNEFSIGALGKSDKPTQWMFLVHEEHGLTSRWPIYGVGRSPVEPYPIPEWPGVD